MPYNHYFLYIKEGEYRFITSKMNINQKEKYFQKVLKIIYNLTSFNFYVEKELLEFDNYDY